jgi:hypothetical protein
MYAAQSTIASGWIADRRAGVLGACRKIGVNEGNDGSEGSTAMTVLLP